MTRPGRACRDRDSDDRLPAEHRALPGPVPRTGVGQKDPNRSSGKAKQARGELACAGEGGESVQGQERAMAAA